MVRMKRTRLVEIDDVNVEDRLSEMPDEIRSSILCRFSMAEVARLGLVSRRWQYLWRCYPRLTFENPNAMRRIEENWAAFAEERPGFVEWLNRVVEDHSGETIEQLKITFDLDRSWQSHIDKWVDFALRKHVKRLELNFDSHRYFRDDCSLSSCITSLWFSLADDHHLPSVCGEPPKLSSIGPSLTSLCLRRVDVNDELIDNLVKSCPLLESLCIAHSKSLTRLSAGQTLLRRLKHLKISRCYNLKTIDICAAKLCSFTHHGHSIQELSIRQASSLCKVSIWDDSTSRSSGLPYMFYDLSEYFCQLEYLTLVFYNYYLYSVLNESYMEIHNPPTLANLKHLELRVFTNSYSSLLGLTSLFATSPHLQKLSLKLTRISDNPPNRRMTKKDGYPIKSLKTLEIVGYGGRIIDLEFAYYVFENATKLEEVIVDFMPLSLPELSEEDAPKRLVELQNKLPQGVKLIVTQVIGLCMSEVFELSMWNLKNSHV